MEDDAVQALEDNIQNINQVSDPVMWNLNSALLAMARQQHEMNERLKKIERILYRPSMQ